MIVDIGLLVVLLVTNLVGITISIMLRIQADDGAFAPGVINVILVFWLTMSIVLPVLLANPPSFNYNTERYVCEVANDTTYCVYAD